jgi:hypothetical protein
MRRLVVGVLVAGCGAHGLATGDGSGSNGGGDDAPIGDTSTADAAWTWQPAITNNWMLGPAGSGSVRTTSSCASIPIAQEMWIDGFRLGSSATTADEHPLLVVTTDPTCGQYDPLSTNDEMLYAGGFGPNNEVDLPSGTAVHITPAMGNLVLYDRLENNTGSTINGSTTIEVHQVADPSTVVHDVDMVLAGTGNSLAIAPPNTMTATGHCHPTITAGYQWHIIGLWPHMHESGTHVTVSIVGGTTLLDTDYSHLDEHWYTIPETLLDTGAELDVTCTMANATTTLTYDEVEAESQGSTVCWTGMYKWPTGTDSATGAPYGPEACVQGAPLH